MLATDLTLTDAGGNTTYSLVSILDGRSIRRDATATMGLPKDLIISHNVEKRGELVIDRHLVRLERTVADATDPSKLATGRVSLVLEVPRTIVTEAQILGLYVQLDSLMDAAGVFDKLLNSEP